MRVDTYEQRRLLAGMAAMQKDPECAEKVAHILGIDTLLEENRAARSSTPLNYLYIMDARISDLQRYFKIGSSIQPHHRLKQIRSGKGANMPPNWEGHRVRPIAIRVGSFTLERAIHRDLYAHRVPNTEWFDANLEVSRYIVDQDAWDVWRGEAPKGYVAESQT